MLQNNVQQLVDTVFLSLVLVALLALLVILNAKMGNEKVCACVFPPMSPCEVGEPVCEAGALQTGRGLTHC